MTGAAAANRAALLACSLKCLEIAAPPQLVVKNAAREATQHRTLCVRACVRAGGRTGVWAGEGSGRAAGCLAPL